MADPCYDEFLPLDCVPAPIILPYFPLKAPESSSQHQSAFDFNGGALIEFQSPPPPLPEPHTPTPAEGFEAENGDGSLPAPRRRQRGLPTRKKHRRAPILKRGVKKAGAEGKARKRKKEDVDAEKEEEAATCGQRKSFEEAVLDRMDMIIGRLDKIIKMSKSRRPT